VEPVGLRLAKVVCEHRERVVWGELLDSFLAKQSIMIEVAKPLLLGVNLLHHLVSGRRN